MAQANLTSVAKIERKVEDKFDAFINIQINNYLRAGIPLTKIYLEKEEHFIDGKYITRLRVLTHSS